MPDLETKELAAVYESKGIENDKAAAMAKDIMQDQQLALEELGIRLAFRE